MTKLRDSLVEAERHAAEGQTLVDEQRAHVAKLTDQCQDARDAEHLLVQFEAVQETLIADRARLRRLVANIETDWPQSDARVRTDPVAGLSRILTVGQAERRN